MCFKNNFDHIVFGYSVLRIILTIGLQWGGQPKLGNIYRLKRCQIPFYWYLIFNWSLKMKQKGHKLDNNYVFRPLISIKISDSSRSLLEEDGKPKTHYERSFDFTERYLDFTERSLDFTVKNWN